MATRQHRQGKARQSKATRAKGTDDLQWVWLVLGSCSFLSRLPWSCPRSVCRGEVCIKDIYDIIIPLDHCLLQDHRTHRHAELHQHEPTICSHKPSYCLFVHCRAHNAGVHSVRDALHDLFGTRCAIGKQIIKLLDRCCNKCRWQDLVPNRDVPMGKGPHGQRLWLWLTDVFFGTSHRHTMLTCHIFVGLPTILPKMKVVAVFCFSLGLKYRQSNIDIGHPDLLPYACSFLCPWLCCTFSSPDSFSL